MNAGIYSFKTMEASKIGILSTKIRNQYTVRRINIYSENTEKQSLNKRDGLRRILCDYKEGKIGIIVFESIHSLGSDICPIADIFKLLYKNRIKFYIIEEDIAPTPGFGNPIIDIIIYKAEMIKKLNHERSRSSNMTKKTVEEVKNEVFSPEEIEKIKEIFNKY